MTRKLHRTRREVHPRAPEKPFFLYLPHNAVHFPLYPGNEYMGKSGKGLLGDWVREVDWSVGQVLDTVRELKLDSNTLVIFTSDNGGPLNQGADNTPLRGGKGSTLEGGIRVCTLAWWPGKVAAGSKTDAITSHMDWLPTFATLGGGKTPADRKIDGIDLSPLLLGQTGSFKARDTFYYYRGFKLEAVRSGPGNSRSAKANSTTSTPTSAKPQTSPPQMRIRSPRCRRWPRR
jgi:arylsulfatase A